MNTMNTEHKGRIIETSGNDTDGYSVTIDGKVVMQFEKPLEPYLFSNPVIARRAAEQLVKS